MCLGGKGVGAGAWGGFVGGGGGCMGVCVRLVRVTKLANKFYSLEMD